MILVIHIVMHFTAKPLFTLHRPKVAGLLLPLMNSKFAEMLNVDTCSDTEYCDVYELPLCLYDYSEAV